ncbi:DUF2764 family protein [Winogradskyella aurantia]|uniref:DUF2764 domain-containing protein n=1 Tax=Winogradskyella aurantia TaxID=1915063 RepID=A0A265US84_9FLAO|nr:DUF2764 family protein [Winogradskyella aurantia]OZV68092.1 hypothetical protein CA834_10625 [Winogradskyella aurantia]
MLTGNLEYLISSLPNLTFSDSESVQHEVSGLFNKYAFNTKDTKDLVAILDEEASKYLSSTAIERFKSVKLNNIHSKSFQNSATEVISDFSKFMFALKSELKTVRLQRKTEESIGKSNYELLGDLPKNPLQAEEYLLNIQWQKLEALSFGHYADFSALVLYKLKLEVLLRWWQFDAEIGFKVFQQSLRVA